MKQYKKPVALVAALALMATLLAGCNSGGNQSGTTLSPEEVMTKVQENLQAVKSLSSNMSMVMDMSVEISGQTQTMDTTTEIKADVINDPMQIQMECTTAASEGEPQKAKMYAEKVDGNVVLYSSWDDGATWQMQNLDTLALAQYGASEGLDQYMKMFKTVKADGVKTVNGVKATKYNCVIPNDKLSELITDSGVMGSISQLPGVTTDSLDTMISDLGDLTFIMWVDTDKLLPVQYEFDMSDIMSKLMENLMTAMGDQAQGMKLKITKTQMQVTITGVDTVSSIEKPAGINA